METKDIIQISTSITALLLSLSGLVFSIYVYRSVSLKSDFKRKQLEVVLKLCDLLQDTIISMSTHKKDDTGAAGNMLRFFHINTFKGGMKGFSDTEAFLIRQNPERTYKFIELGEHPYIPPQIAKKISRFVAYVYDPIDYKKFNSFTILDGSGMLEFEKNLYVVNDNPVYKNLETFMDACRDLDQEIHKWLKSIGITEFNKKDIIP